MLLCFRSVFIKLSIFQDLWISLANNTWNEYNLLQIPVRGNRHYRIASCERDRMGSSDRYDHWPSNFSGKNHFIRLRSMRWKQVGNCGGVGDDNVAANISRTSNIAECTIRPSTFTSKIEFEHRPHIRTILTRSRVLNRPEFLQPSYPCRIWQTDDLYVLIIDIYLLCRLSYQRVSPCI